MFSVLPYLRPFFNFLMDIAIIFTGPRHFFLCFQHYQASLGFEDSDVLNSGHDQPTYRVQSRETVIQI